MIYAISNYVGCTHLVKFEGSEAGRGFAVSRSADQVSVELFVQPQF